MEDNYSHEDEQLIYVVENIPGPSENSQEHSKIFENFNSQLTHKCSCKIMCVHTKCECYKMSGGINYIMNSKYSKLQLNKDKINVSISNPIIECNDLCSCSENCCNRLVQKGPLKSLYIKECLGDKGQGLFSKHHIPKHTFVCEYAGEIITKTQAITRNQSNIINEKMNYIFCLNEHSDDKIIQTFVDPSEFGNIGRYANHSCNPNCFIVPVRVNTPIPKLALFSCTDILPHSEITFHYGSNYSADLLPTTGKKTKCLCNSDKCTGWMPYQSY